jgi:F-type H+-transporting ATPase subunit alpha
MYGVIISISAGVVTIQGFLIAFVSEVFQCSLSSGLVVNLYQNDSYNLTIGALLLNPHIRISEGAKVIGISRLATIILGDVAIGSILDPMGNLLFQSSSISLHYRWVVESPATISRQSVCEPLQTGILAIDSMIPIGRGQRELVVGDRQTGKTSIGIDTILNQKHEKLLCIYVPIGNKASSILAVFLHLARRDSVFYVSTFIASASLNSLYLIQLYHYLSSLCSLVSYHPSSCTMIYLDML